MLVKSDYIVFIGVVACGLSSRFVDVMAFIAILLAILIPLRMVFEFYARLEEINKTNEDLEKLKAELKLDIFQLKKQSKNLDEIVNRNKQEIEAILNAEKWRR